jgi:hypothetical protein
MIVKFLLTFIAEAVFAKQEKYYDGSLASSIV